MISKQEKHTWESWMRQMLKESANGYSHHRLPTLAAAIAYRGLFSAIPLMVIFAASYASLQHFFSLAPFATTFGGMDLEWMMGGIVKETTTWRQMIDQPGMQLIGLGLIVYGASTAFRELSSALEVIFEVQHSSRWRGAIRQRLLALGVVAGLTICLIVALFSNWLLNVIGAVIGEQLLVGGIAIQFLQWSVLPGLTLLFFIAIYRLIPFSAYRVREILPGAILTSLLFWVGQRVMGWWLGYVNLSSVSGIAGSIIFFLLWCYYTSLLILLGAEWIRAQKRLGGTI